MCRRIIKNNRNIVKNLGTFFIGKRGRLGPSERGKWVIKSQQSRKFFCPRTHFSTPLRVKNRTTGVMRIPDTNIATKARIAAKR